MSNTAHTPLPPLPKSWSELTWRQLCQCWEAKMRYGGNADVARAAALLALCGLNVRRGSTASSSPLTGEALYPLRSADGRPWTVTPRELAHLASKALTWFDFPYGDQGEKEVRDKQGKVVKERREAVTGYVNPGFRDAMAVPVEQFAIHNSQFIIPGEKRSWWKKLSTKVFALPQLALNNLTWQQYRSLQAIAPQLFREGITEAEATALQGQFLAHCLVPRSLALLDTTGGSIRLRPHWEFRYNAEQAEGLARWWERRLRKDGITESRNNGISKDTAAALFHICFQCYQTALQYYEKVFPLLFQDSGKSDPLRDALTGEVGTINTVMKYAGYAEQQQVYDSNLPFVLDILNTMTKEAKEIEKMNSKIKKK